MTEQHMTQQSHANNPQDAGLFTGLLGYFDPDSHRRFRTPEGECFIVIGFDPVEEGSSRIPAVVTEESFPDLLDALLDQADGNLPVIHGFTRPDGSLDMMETGLRSYSGRVARIRQDRNDAGPFVLGLLDVSEDTRLDETRTGDVSTDTSGGVSGDERKLLPFRAYGEDAATVASSVGRRLILDGHIAREADAERHPCLVVHMASPAPVPEHVPSDAPSP